MHATDEEYLTVDEAARILRVSTPTIRRWIRQGDLPAYRIGKRRVALKREDIDSLIAPARSVSEIPHYKTYTDLSQVSKSTPEDIQRGLEAMERLQQHSREILGRSAGPFPPSWIVIREMREERTRQLG